MPCVVLTGMSGSHYFQYCPARESVRLHEKCYATDKRYIQMLIVISSGFSRCEVVTPDVFHILSCCLFIDMTLDTSRFTCVKIPPAGLEGFRSFVFHFLH